MNRTYGLFFFIVKNTMFILNVIIVLFYVAVIAITTKYIIGNDLARSFLDKVMYMPTAPVYIISGSVGLLLCLAYCVYYREFNNIRNKTITEAEKILKNAGFTTKITTSNDKNSTQVIDQVPKPGVSLAKNSIIMLYDQSVRTTTTVPDLTGKSASQATSELRNLNLNISITGSGVIISQDPAKGSKVDEGTVIKVTLKPATTDVH